MALTAMAGYRTAAALAAQLRCPIRSPPGSGGWAKGFWPCDTSPVDPAVEQQFPLKKLNPLCQQVRTPLGEMLRFNKEKKIAGLFLLLLTSSILIGCGSANQNPAAGSQDQSQQQKYPFAKKVDTRAFLFAGNSGMIITVEKNINYHQGCAYDFADVLASFVRTKLVSEGFQAEPVNIVASSEHTLAKWKKQMEKKADNLLFTPYRVDFYQRDNMYILSCGDKSSVFFLTPINFTPSNYTDSAACYADFKSIVKAFLDVFYQEMLTKRTIPEL
ncbi:MAG: hypothetical protein FWD79_10025 [Desulfobulbus sp.]|nr:hypothetical protein [Desulfobulbus sp.]